MPANTIDERPLSGYRVLELGNFIAAPFGARLLADFGAEVIKIERPGAGDELRRWRLMRGETSLLFLTQARNKRSITLDLRKPEGQQIALRLAASADVIVENFRPGTLERWGLGFDQLREANPDLILTRISGYGQTGPYAHRAGFGGVAEAVGGLRNLTGHPDRPPTRVGISLADSLAGMFGVIGALMALLRRETARVSEIPEPDGYGQVIDVALYEAVFALMESLVPEYDGYRVVRERTGNYLPGIAPSNTYPCRDEDKWVVIGANSDGLFRRLMNAIGWPDLAEAPDLQSNPGRAARQQFLDEVIAEWTAERTLDEVMTVMEGAAIPAGPINKADDIIKDPHFLARDMLQTHRVRFGPDDEQEIRFPGVVPKLSATPGAVHTVGPRLGQHNDEVYGGLLGIDAAELDRLRAKEVI